MASVSAQFTADFTQFNQAAKGAQDALVGVEEQAEKTGGITQEQAFYAGHALKDFGAEIANVAKTFISSYAEEEAATRALESALVAQGEGADDVMRKYQEMAGQFQATTRFADESVLRAQELFTTIGQVGPEQMQPAIEAAANLAARLKIDLPDAAMMLAKAASSGGESLGKLKTILGEAYVEGMSFDEILGALNAKLGAAAVAEAASYGGQMTILGNQFDDVKEKIGGVLVTVITPLMEAFTSLPAGVQEVTIGIGLLATALTPLAVAFGAVMAALGPLLGAGGFAALLPFLGPAGWIAAGVLAVYVAFRHWDDITGFVKGVYDGIKTWLVDGFNALVGSIQAKVEAVTGFFKGMYDKVVGNSYVPDMINGIQAEFARLGDVMIKPSEAAAGAVEGIFARAAQAVGGMMGPSGIVTRGGRVLDMFGNPQTIPGSMINLPRVEAGFERGRDFTTININGSVLGNKDEIARVVGDAVTSSYRSGGYRLPT